MPKGVGAGQVKQVNKKNRNEGSNEMRKMEKVKVSIGMFLMLTAIMIITSGQAFAAYDATWSSGGESSYTRAMGASKSATFYYSISENYGAYKAQIKDPSIWHTRQDGSGLLKGKHETFKRTEGYKNAYWRGWVKNGYIKVTV